MTQRPLERVAPAMLPPGARVRTRPASPQEFAHHSPRQSGHLEGGDTTIIPSIEGPDGSYPSSRARRNPFERHSEPRETNLAREQGRSLRDVAFVDLTSDSIESTPKRRRLDDFPPVPQRRTMRRDSPGRPLEHLHMPQPQSRPAHIEDRIVNYGEPRSSPRARPAFPTMDPGYADREPVHDIRDLPHNGALFHQPILASHESHEPMSMQPRYHPPSHTARSRDDFEMMMPTRGLEQAISRPVSRVYEPIVESRSHDTRIMRESEMALREHYVQSLPQESRIRYIYPPGSNVREPLQELASQRVLEYDYRPPASARPYAH